LGGAALVQRDRFASEISQTVYAELGPDYPVIIGLSQ
jgi:hypothetical protein